MSEKTQPQRLLEAVTGEGGADDEDLKRQVFEALGLASMQWQPRPAGVFDSTGCEAVGNELWKAIRARITELRKANDELFTIKQKTVIANRELIQKLAFAESAIEKATAAIKRITEERALEADMAGKGATYNRQWAQQIRHREALARKQQKATALASLIEEWEAEEHRRSLTDEEQEYLRDLRHRHRAAHTQLTAMAGGGD